MINEVSLLVSLVDQLPKPVPSPKRERGRPKIYPDQLFLKALVVMIVKDLHTINELRNVLDEPTSEMQCLKAEFILDGRYPTRRTWERRLGAIPISLPAQIALLGQHLVNLIKP